MFVVTNVDDLVLLALFFGRLARKRGGSAKVVAGQYLGFGAILVVSVAGALGTGLLPDSVLPYLGLLPVLLGVRAAWEVWRERGASGDPEIHSGPTVLAMATVTFANGGDNVGVYVPVFAGTGTGGLVVYTVVFLVLVAVSCVAGRAFATRPLVARALARWGHLGLLPLVLIAVGVPILVGAL